MFRIRLINDILLLYTIIACALHFIRAQDATKLEDCDLDQFYSPKEEICKNCSDLHQILSSYQEWLAREVSEIRSRPTVGEGQDKPRPSSGRGKNKKGKDSNLPKSNDNSDSPRLNNDVLDDSMMDKNDVLSRLINVAPQDQDSSESVDLQADANDGDVAPKIVSNGDSTDASTSIATQTKQIQKFVNRFVQSSLVGDELLETISQCRQNQNVDACQKWSNFCILSMYSHSSSNGASSSSQLMAGIKEEPGYSTSSSQPKWQECPQINSNTICNAYRDWFRLEKKSSLEMQSIFASEETSLKFGSNMLTRINQPIQLLAYRYSLDGSSLGVDHFGLNDMIGFCFDSQKVHRPYENGNGQIRVGQSLHRECKFSLSEAKWLAKSKSSKDTVFIDLFIGFSSSGTAFVKPVPILIKNVLYNGVQINRKNARDSSRWKLVHRFFPHSIITLDDASRKSNQVKKNQNNEDVLIYAKNAHLDIKLKRQDKGLIVHSILLVLDYNIIPHINAPERTNSTSSPHALAVHETDLMITQTLVDMLSYRKNLDLAMTILSILSSIWSLIRCYNLQKCYGTVKLDFNSLFTFVIISCDTVANLFATVTFLFSAYLFVAVKFRLNSQTFAPVEDLEDAIITNMELAFVFKLVGLVHKFYVHLTTDIFFIDWEKPKMLTSSQILNNTMHHDRSKNKSTEINQSTIQGNFQPPDAQQSSFWRPYTVVNQWLRLLTSRRQNLSLQLILFACIVDMTLITSLATTDPSIETSAPTNEQALSPNMSSTFRLFILASVYILLSFIQVSYMKYIHEAMVRNAAYEFVDLCSVANVSVFCMQYPRFGYYIHGRNANGAGDCNIVEMNALLEREEKDLCSKRGLLPNSDQQTFIMILPRIINEHFRKLLFTNETIVSQHQLNKQSNPNLSHLGENNLIGNGGLLRSALKSSSAMSSSLKMNRATIETVVTRNRAINTFLVNFIEHIYKDIDYTIRASRKFESFLLDVDFNDENLAARNGPIASIGGQDKPQAAATFCMDENDSFTSLFWLGLELDFILIELLSILVLDVWFNQQPMLVTVGLVWLLHNTFKSIYIYYARQNLVSKALIDEKFLVR